jgi:biotin transporter BioY
LLNYYIQFHRNLSIDFLIKVIISCLLLYFLGPVIVEMKGDMPITLQTLVILFIAIGFGWKIGLVALSAYLIAGAAGLPVFAGYSGGYKAFFGAFGGFFFGFVAATIVCGYLTEWAFFRKAVPAILNWFIGHAIILLFGIIWMMKFNPDWAEKLKSLLPGAAIKSIFGALIIHLIIKMMTRTRAEAFQD